MKWNKKHIILAILLPFQIFVIWLIKDYSHFIETYYSNGIYPYISSFLRIIFGWIPYSVGDIFLVILIILIIRFIFISVKNKFKFFLPRFIHLLAFTSIIYFCFYFFWALNYFREPLEKKLGFTNTTYTTSSLENTTEYIIENLNKLQFEITKNDTISVINPYNSNQNFNIAIKGYKNLANDFTELSYQFKSVKKSSISKFQSYIGTSGYLNPLTGEAHVNDLIPKTGFPTTTCHEMAHQIGFAAENEANFIGFLAANYSDDIYFKYASYRMAFSYCISEVRKRDYDLYKRLWKKVNKGIRKDFSKSYMFWESYKNPFEPLFKKGYNVYLKSNNQEKGTDSYNYVVDLMISYFDKYKKL